MWSRTPLEEAGRQSFQKPHNRSSLLNKSRENQISPIPYPLAPWPHHGQGQVLVEPAFADIAERHHLDEGEAMRSSSSSDSTSAFGRMNRNPCATVVPAQQSPVDKDEREQYCTEAILRPCVYRESPNGM
jgi:hypothetical protein